MEHKELLEKTLVNTNGFILAVDNRHPKFPEFVASVDTLNPEFVNVFWASILLYRTMGETNLFLDSMVEYLEANGLDEAVGSINNIQASLNTAMKLAREGMPKKMQDDVK